jgi:hypothetical protein
LTNAHEISEVHSRELSTARLAYRFPALGRLPEVIIWSSIGLLVVALAFSSGLSGNVWAYFFYWLGLLLIIAPIAYRLFSAAVSRRERIGLLIFMGFSLYLVKVMHSPYMFTFSDELLHFRNAVNILQSGTLFSQNSILPTSALYPGLETVSTAIASLSGLNLFTSGVLVIGVARLVIILSLYLLFEQVSRSSRIAGLAVLIYIANSNFLYWSAQFSYESLSLPLGILVLFSLAKYSNSKDSYTKRSLTLVMLLLIATIIVTHHITSYALVVFLAALSIVNGIKQRNTNQKQPNTWGLTLATAGLTLIWLVSIASPTYHYLYQIFKFAITSILQLFTGEQTARVLFSSNSGSIAPLWEQLIGIASVLLIMLGIPAGLFTIWKRKKLNPFAIVLGYLSLLYFGTVGLRFIGAGWEIGNRSSEFLFVGISFLIAYAFVTLRLRFPKSPYIPVLFVFYAVILFMGGLISGWPPALRLSQPLVAAVDGTTVQPQGLEASNWLLTNYGPDNRIIAPTADALAMLAYGRQEALTGKIYSIQELLTQNHALSWQTKILQSIQSRFLLMDRRQISWDGMLGLYYSTNTSPPLTAEKYFPSDIFNMFDRSDQIPRIFDSGDIVIYDVGALSSVSPIR